MQVDGALVDKVSAGTAAITLANTEYSNIIMSNCDYFKEFYMHLCRVTTKYVFDILKSNYYTIKITLQGTSTSNYVTNYYNEA